MNFLLGVTLRHYERISTENRRFRSNGFAPTDHSSCYRTRVNSLSCGIRMRVQFSFVLSQITRLTDRRTDGILIAGPRLHSMRRGKNCSYAADFIHWHVWSLAICRQVHVVGDLCCWIIWRFLAGWTMDPCIIPPGRVLIKRSTDWLTSKYTL